MERIATNLGVSINEKKGSRKYLQKCAKLSKGAKINKESNSKMNFDKLEFPNRVLTQLLALMSVSPQLPFALPRQLSAGVAAKEPLTIFFLVIKQTMITTSALTRTEKEQ